MSDKKLIKLYLNQLNEPTVIGGVRRAYETMIDNLLCYAEQEKKEWAGDLRRKFEEYREMVRRER